MIALWASLPASTRRALLASLGLLVLGVLVGVFVASPAIRGHMCALLGLGGLAGAGVVRARQADRRAREEAANEARAHAERLQGATDRTEQARTDALGDSRWRERVDDRISEWAGDDK